jgi:hypothetical protein
LVLLTFAWAIRTSAINFRLDVKSSGFCEISPMPACSSEQGGSQRRGGPLAPQMNRRNSMTRFTKKQRRDQVPIEIEDVCIDDQDRKLNPIGRFYRHNAMHAGTTPMAFDEFGRCA